MLLVLHNANASHQPRLWMTRHYSRPIDHPAAQAYEASGQIGNGFSIMVTAVNGSDCRHARLAGPGLVFVQANKKELDVFVKLVQPFIKHPYVLMTGGSDNTLPYQNDKRSPPYDAESVARIKAIAHDPRLVAWFAENLDEVWSPKMRPSPLGFHARSHEELWAARAWRMPNRTRFVQASSRVRTGPQWEDRKRMTRAANARGFATTEVPFVDWLRVLGHSTHVVCAHGGGWDPNPRLFEALWMGALPIAKRHPTTQLALRRFPILWINDWDELATLDLDAHADLERAARNVDAGLFTEAFWLAEMWGRLLSDQRTGSSLKGGDVSGCH